MKYIKSTFLVLSVILFTSCSKTEGIKITPKDYHALVDQLTEVMIHDIFSPPVASRIYTYPNIAAYEVFNSENGVYKSLTNQLNGLQPLKIKSSKQINKPLASLIAYLDVAKELIFSKEIIQVYRDSLYTSWKNKNSTQFTDSKAYALQISSQIINWMNTDKYNETRTMPEFNIYSKDTSRWQPTPPAYMKGIEPHWGKLRPFVLDSATQFKPVPPPKFSMKKGTPFHNELMDLYNLTTDIIKKGNESEELAIAQFWDCNPYISVNKGHFMFASKKITPGAHWIGICKIAAQKDNANFNKTVFTYTKTSIAIADGFISCWDEKYRSNLIRPETLINAYIDDAWYPLLQTPPFPEYTSGHSVVSGAASEVLTSIFGDNFVFDDTTEIPFGLPKRSYTSFRKAAQEAAISRIYGGIHYNSAVQNGLTQGINLGNFVVEKLEF